MRNAGRWLTLRARLYRPDGNRLRRRSDRLESFAVLVSLLLFAGGFALAFAVGDSVYRGGVAAERSGRWVSALAARDAPVPRVSAEGMSAQPPVAVTWTEPGGRTVSGEAPVVSGTKAGAVVQVWLDASGTPGAGPPDHGVTLARTVASALGTVAVCGVLLLGCLALVRRALDRGRYADWDLAWFAADQRRWHKPETS
ncbi:hypothetical protein [Sphaerisporangium sp. TRM90804]|uniref:Rv1733c family protein n=1 Tax=Sphaerisporangium sp. TRM90804 TaxID=3031113 RepID=UPI0024481CE7|nr:hypothetical protein [Sphaerisporangium sp. TRM90804]MDH2427483.1 hypothetical protein [Sphaerisporangium sp. TRM90804]